MFEFCDVCGVIINENRYYYRIGRGKTIFCYECYVGIQAAKDEARKVNNDSSTC